MAFINERISEEDRKQYGLDEVWEKYKRDTSINILCKTPYEWTIDKDTDSRLIYFARVIAEEHDHGYGYTNEHVFLFNFQKMFFEVRLNREEKSVFDQDHPGNLVSYSSTWDLLSINPKPENSHTFKESFKKALEEYGKNGTFSENIKSQTTVVCNF